MYISYFGQRGEEGGRGVCGGERVSSPPVVSRSGFLALSQCLRLAWEGVILKKALFLWNQNPEFPRFHFPPSKSHLAFSRAEIRARVQTALPYLPSPSSIRLASHCSPSVPCVWGPRVHVAREETRVNSRKLRASPEHKVEKTLFRSLCITTFVYTCSGHAYSGQ